MVTGLNRMARANGNGSGNGGVNASRHVSFAKSCVAFMLSIILASILVATTVNGADGCQPLPSSSVCARFYSGAQHPNPPLVHLFPTNCSNTVEAELATAPVVWDSLNKLANGTDGAKCADDIAQLMCMRSYTPCNDGQSTSINRSVCTNALGASGSCTATQQAFLQGVIKQFTTVYDCSSSAFADDGSTVPNPTMPAPVPQCVDIAPTSVCAKVVNYPVYLPWHIPAQQYIEAQVAHSFSVAFRLASVGNGCLDSVSKSLCSTAYMRCDTTVLQTSLDPFVPASHPLHKILPLLTVPFPRLPCYDRCQVANGECAALLASSPDLQSALNCSGVGTALPARYDCNGNITSAPGPNFPNGTTTLGTITLQGAPVPISSECNAFNESAAEAAARYAQFESSLTCPDPLVRAYGPGDPHAVLGGVCATPCRSLALSDQHWKDGDGMFSALAIISFVCAIVLWLTWIIFPARRKQTNAVMFNTCILVLAFVMVLTIGETDGHPSVIGCRDPSTQKQRDDGGVCLLQSMCFQLFTLAGMCFWLVSAVDLYLKIVLNWKIDIIKQKKLNRLYMVLGWGFPTLFTIIALGLDAQGGAAALPWCLFKTGNAAYIDWAFFYYPAAVLLLIGSFCMGSIIWKMIASARRTGSNRRPGWWRAQIRPMLFIFVFVFIFTFIFGYRVDYYFEEPSYTASGTEYVACIMQSLGDHALCGDRPKVAPNVGLWFMIMIVVGGQGIFNGVIFGLQWSNALLWFGLLTGKGTNYTAAGAQTESRSRTQGESSRNLKNTERFSSERGLTRSGTSRLAGVVPGSPGARVTGVSAAHTAAAAGGPGSGVSSGQASPASPASPSMSAASSLDRSPVVRSTQPMSDDPSRV